MSAWNDQVRFWRGCSLGWTSEIEYGPPDLWDAALDLNADGMSP